MSQPRSAHLIFPSDIERSDEIDDGVSARLLLIGEAQ
jgi:hypothetical protein